MVWLWKGNRDNQSARKQQGTWPRCLEGNSMWLECEAVQEPYTVICDTRGVGKLGTKGKAEGWTNLIHQWSQRVRGENKGKRSRLGRTKNFVWDQRAAERERWAWHKLERWNRERERDWVRESAEAGRSSSKKTAPSFLLYYITLVDKKNPTSSKVITAQ